VQNFFASFEFYVEITVRDRFDWITFPNRFNVLYILYTIQYTELTFPNVGRIENVPICTYIIFNVLCIITGGLNKTYN